MPGLIRGVARTAVVAGTATAVSGRVQRRQAEKYTQRDANIAAERTEAYEEQVGGDQGQYAEQAPAAPAGPDKLTQLKELGQLKADGILTEAEFEAEKAKILAG